MAYVNDGYIMLLDALIFNGVKIGNISDEGIDWGGDSAEYIKLWAAQVRNAPVKKIKKKDGTNILKFTLIELIPENCAAVMGGTVTGDRWDAPANSVTLEGPLKILAGTGQTIDIRSMTLDGLVRGKIGGDSALGIECELEMVSQPGTSPFAMYPTEPFITAAPSQLSFSKAGESKTIAVEASGPFTPGAIPDGFSMEIVNGQITVTASPNDGVARGGSVEFTLASHPAKKVTVSLTQAGGA